MRCVWCYRNGAFQAFAKPLEVGAPHEAGQDGLFPPALAAFCAGDEADHAAKRNPSRGRTARRAPRGVCGAIFRKNGFALSGLSFRQIRSKHLGQPIDIALQTIAVGVAGRGIWRTSRLIQKCWNFRTRNVQVNEWLRENVANVA